MPLFEWDEVKANSNLQKHKVNFEEVKTVFDDPLARIFDDEIKKIIIEAIRICEEKHNKSGL